MRAFAQSYSLGQNALWHKVVVDTAYFNLFLYILSIYILLTSLARIWLPSCVDIALLVRTRTNIHENNGHAGRC